MVGEHIISADNGYPTGDIAPASSGQISAGLQTEICGRRWPQNDGSVCVYKFNAQEDGRVGQRGYVCNQQAENRGAVIALANCFRGKSYVRKGSAV